MTNEQHDRLWSIQFSIPDVPYSAMVVPSNLDMEGLAQAMDQAQAFREAYLAVFADLPFPAQQPRQDAPQREPAATPPPRTAPPQNGASRAQGSGLFCPDHRSVELVQSADQYQRWDDGPNGERIAAKFYCPSAANGTGQNHQVWRSKAVAA